MTLKFTNSVNAVLKNNFILRLIVKNFDEILRFLFVGVIAVLIDGVAYALMVRFYGIEPEISKRISFILGALWVFFANKYFTFKSIGPARKEMVLFALLYFTSFYINGLIHDLAWSLSSVDWFSFLTATFASTIVNYIGQKFIVFKHR